MEPFIGQIQAFGFNFAPRGWAACNGQLLPIAQNTALFSLLGTTYGGDGRTTFGLPDLRGRAPMHYGNGPGLTSRPLGQHSGSEINILNSNQLPAHKHAIDFTSQTVNASVSIPAVNDDGTTDETENNVLANNAASFSPSANADTNLFPFNAKVNGSANTTNTGASSPVNNMQPYLVVNYCIATVGIFPPRS